MPYRMLTCNPQIIICHSGPAITYMWRHVEAAADMGGRGFLFCVHDDIFLSTQTTEAADAHTPAHMLKHEPLPQSGLVLIDTLKLSAACLPMQISGSGGLQRSRERGGVVGGGSFCHCTPTHLSPISPGWHLQHPLLSAGMLSAGPAWSKGSGVIGWSSEGIGPGPEAA